MTARTRLHRAKVRIVTKGAATAPVIEGDGVNLASVVGPVTIDWQPGKPPVVTLTIPSPILLLEADAEVVAKVQALAESTEVPESSEGGP